MRANRFPRLLFVALLAAAAVAVAPAIRVRADGGGDDGAGGGAGGAGGKEGGKDDGKDPHGGGEAGGEMGGDAPPAEKPTMDGAIEMSDAKRIVAIKVPKGWKQPENFEPKGTRVAFFFGSMTMNAPGNVELHVDAGRSRAALALSQFLHAAGKPAAEESRTGPGWVEGGASIEGQRPVFIWERAIEKDGVVYVARVLTYLPAKDEAKALVRQILDSFRVAGGAPKPQPAKDVSVRKAGAFDVWTDSEDKGKPTKVAELAAEGRDAAAKCLKGKPFDESRPVVRAHQVGSFYVDLMTPAYGEAPDFAAYDPLTRSVGAQMYRMDHDDFPYAVREAGARQYVVQYFGGSPPAWVEFGLAAYAGAVAQSGGKADKPPTARQDKARQVVASGKRTLGEWLDAEDAGDKTNGPLELWAWHWFLRNGPGRKYAKQYAAYLDTLRQTGDVGAAKKAWDGVDFAAMNTEFRDWGSKWK